MKLPKKIREQFARAGRKGGKVGGKKTGKKGFAAMDPEKRRAIQSMGGKAPRARYRTVVETDSIVVQSLEPKRKGGKSKRKT